MCLLHQFSPAQGEHNQMVNTKFTRPVNAMPMSSRDLAEMWCVNGGANILALVQTQNALHIRDKLRKPWKTVKPATVLLR